MTYQLVTLGAPHLVRADGSAADLPLGKPFALLTYVAIEPGPLGDRTYDDHYVQLEHPATFALEGGGRRVEVEFGEGYPYAQEYAPLGTGDEPYVCFEPMTAPVNALISGDGLRSVPPGGSFRADFTVRVT